MRNFGRVLAGFLAASLVMMVIEHLNGQVVYPGLARAAEGVTDREGLRRVLATAPVGALGVVVLGWGLGGLAGGWVTFKLAVRGSTLPGFAVCALLTLAGVANNLLLPPPAWFWAVSLMVLAGSTPLGAHRLPRPRA